MIRGLSVPVSAIAAAYGPSGRKPVFHRPPAPPEIVFDGLAIASRFQPAKSLESQAGKILYEALYDFDRDYGDGSSGLALMIYEIMVKSQTLLEAGFAPDRIAENLLCAEKLAETMLASSSQPFDDALHSYPVCLTASCNDAEAAEKIDSLAKKLGNDGHISLKEGYELETRETIFPGMSLPAGLISSDLMTSKIRCSEKYVNPYILLCDEKIDDFGRLVPVLEGFSRTKKSLMIICRDLTGSALATLAANVRKSNLKAGAIAVPEVGNRVYEVLEDIAAFTSATVVSPRLGHCLQSLRPEMLGNADQVEVSFNSCVMIRKSADSRRLEARKQMIRHELQSMRYLSYDREKLQIRLARLSGGIGELRVGAHSQQEQKQKMVRYRKALCALQSAKRFGVVPGAGSICAQVGSELNRHAQGNTDNISFGALSSALHRPLRQLTASVGHQGTGMFNGGFDDQHQAARVFDVRKRDFANLAEAKIYDSAEIVAASVKHAVSVAATLLKSDVSISRDQ